MSTTSRGNKGESLVKKELKKIKINHFLFNNYTSINKKTNSSIQIDHILIHPHGVFVIETKNYYGTIIPPKDKDGLWYKVINNEKIIIASPVAQNKSHCYFVSTLLEKKYDVISIVVYSKNNAPYMDEENVINLSDLLLFIDSYPYNKLLTDEEMKYINNILKKEEVEISSKEHIKNVKEIKKKKDEKRDDMRIAIEEGICPMCGAKILVKGYTYRCSKCSYHFSI